MRRLYNRGGFHAYTATRQRLSSADSAAAYVTRLQHHRRAARISRQRSLDMRWLPNTAPSSCCALPLQLTGYAAARVRTGSVLFCCQLLLPPFNASPVPRVLHNVAARSSPGCRISLCAARMPRFLLCAAPPPACRTTTAACLPALTILWCLPSPPRAPAACHFSACLPGFSTPMLHL